MKLESLNMTILCLFLFVAYYKNDKIIYTKEFHNIFSSTD